MTSAAFRRRHVPQVDTPGWTSSSDAMDAAAEAAAAATAVSTTDGNRIRRVVQVVR